MVIRIIREVIAEHPLVSAHKSMSVREACRLMVEKHIGALLVLEGERILGIFTERNALTRILAPGRDPDTTTVGEVMVADPVCIAADKPLTQALLLMADGGFRHVPVVDDAGRAIGMVSARDALGHELVEVGRGMTSFSKLESSLAY
ncbi:cyclic nucleotide-binding/CBS domain-containing protein [Azonexus sp.]|uniref:CBS domain-containing protein n=1 Tax=Azonexus sp. TaxID=1872668 RepID=UPI0039E2ADCD